MSKALDYMALRGWLEPDDIILDPMCGIGSFLIVAAMKGHNCIGVELEENFIDLMEGYDTVVNDDMIGKRVDHVLGNLEKFRRVTKVLPHVGSIKVFQGDARKLHFTDFTIFPPDAVICSPPYGNRLRDAAAQFGSKDDITWSKMEAEVKGSYNKQYSLNPKNIGNAKIKVVCSPPYHHGEHSEKKIASIKKHEEREQGHGMKAHSYVSESNIANIATDSKYSYEMLKVYKSLYQFLADGAVVALVTRNFIQKKKVVMLDKLTIRLMERAGFMYLETKRARNPEVSFFRQINHKTLKKYGLPLIDWEEITFYRR